jgi:hypothetical protein
MVDELNVRAIAAEVACENFDDERLTKRLAIILEGVARDPQASLPSVLSSAELEGAYRFFSNPLVTPTRILAPHQAATKARAANETRVRVVHDQTEFAYRHQGKRKGLGDRAHQGFCGHFSLVLSDDAARTPLGLAGVHTWVRDVSDETEQSLWLKQIEATAELLDCGDKVVHVCDRGSEDYVLFEALIARGHRFVIRTGGRRYTESGPERERQLLREAITTIEGIAERTARINRRKKHSRIELRKIHPPREPRLATLHIAATTTELCRPMNYGKKGKCEHLGALPKTLTMNVVRVWEPTPPAGEQPIEWILLTNESIATVEDVLAIVDHYRARWTIEEYFKALKTGCAFESRQLHDYEALTNALAVFVPLAFHMLLLRTVARTAPDAPARTVASEEEIEVLRIIGRRPLPPDPTARDILLAIAALGGHIKYAPDPGWLTIGRGYEKLNAYVVGWRAAKLQLSSDQR